LKDKPAEWQLKMKTHKAQHTIQLICMCVRVCARQQYQPVLDMFYKWKVIAIIAFVSNQGRVVAVATLERCQ